MDNENENLIENENNSTEEKGELEFNKNNREYSEKLMEDASINRDGYWDSNNVFVKILLLVLGLIIIGGVVYYVFTYMGSK